MSTKTRTNVEALIDELHRSAARNLALREASVRDFPWREHDYRIYTERAEADLLAARHLMGEL